MESTAVRASQRGDPKLAAVACDSLQAEWVTGKGGPNLLMNQAHYGRLARLSRGDMAVCAGRPNRLTGADRGATSARFRVAGRA